MGDTLGQAPAVAVVQALGPAFAKPKSVNLASSCAGSAPTRHLMMLPMQLRLAGPSRNRPKTAVHEEMNIGSLAECVPGSATFFAYELAVRTNVV